ncbi:MAG: thioredoxin [Deltaproteobacteria bacterium]|jgi:thioredoxin 1|nr:thioredoxin [Deltaproteobacteria bacterium]
MSDNITVLTDATFSDFVQGTPLSLVDFWAPWCGPCQALAPVLDELAGEMKDRLKFAKINVDENGDTATQFRIRSIPCLIVFRGEEEAGRILGHKDKADLQAELEKLL